MINLMDFLGHDSPDIKTVDVGNMDVDEQSGIVRTFIRRDRGSFIGFEPVPEKCDALNAKQTPRHTYLPYFIGNGEDATFHLCSAAMTSSLFEPNRALLDLFNNLGELTQVVSTSRVKTKRLDDIPECAETDFLRIDVQGAELAVMKGGVNVLKHAVVVEAEAEFVPLYKDQPLFADLDVFMRSQGFLLHSIPGVAGRVFKPLLLNNDVNAKLNQTLWTNAVWVKDFTKFRALSAEQTLKLAVIINDRYGSLDLAAFALQYYDEKKGTNLWEKIMKQLFGGVVPPRGPMP